MLYIIYTHCNSIVISVGNSHFGSCMCVPNHTERELEKRDTPFCVADYGKEGVRILERCDLVCSLE